jgi:hypothetical protein
MKHILRGAATKALERIAVGGSPRALYLGQDVDEPAVAGLSLSAAADRLRDGLGRLPQLARALEQQPTAELIAAAAAGEPAFFLALDHEEPPGIALRPHLPDDSGQPTGLTAPDLTAAAKPLSQLLEPLELDPPTVADDNQFFSTLERQPNLPDAVKQRLPDLY